MQNEIEFEKNTPKNSLKKGLLGFLIGLGVVIPGVSGAHIAILFKLYDKLTYALGNILKKFVICILFLLPIIIGLVIGFVAGFFAVKELLKICTFTILCFFAGMMLGATPIVVDEVKKEKINFKKILLFVVGLIIPIGISITAIYSKIDLSSHFMPISPVLYAISVPLGILIALTQIIPGLSATSTLLAFGVYKPIIQSVSMTYWKANPMIWIIYIELLVGFLIGLICFAKLINIVIDKFKNNFYYLAFGLTISSIVSMFYNPEVTEIYQQWSAGQGNMKLELILGPILFIVGIAVTSSLYFFFIRKKETTEQ